MSEQQEPQWRQAHLRREEITWDPRLQMRVALSEPTVEAYAERYRQQLEMDEVRVVYDAKEGVYWGVDGFQRDAAAARAAIDSWAVLVTDGDWKLARRLARSLNAKHGLPFGREDQQRRVRAAVEDAPEQSDRAIARELGCSGHTVRDERRRAAFETIKADPAVTDLELLAAWGIREEAAELRRCAASGATAIEARSTERKKEAIKEAARSRTPESASDEQPADEHSRAIDQKNKRIERARKLHPPEEVLKDALGNVVPEILHDVFASSCLAELAEEVRGLSPAFEPATYERRAERLLPVYPYLRELDFAARLHELAQSQQDAAGLAANALVCALPYAVCPECSGQGKVSGCDNCMASGYLPRHRAAQPATEVA